MSIPWNICQFREEAEDINTGLHDSVNVNTIVREMKVHARELWEKDITGISRNIQKKQDM